MNLIVAVDKNWAIGKDGDLLISIPEDMKFFRDTTMNKVVVMGRKTLESFPGSKPLKDRTNIVLTTDCSYAVEGAIIVHSLDELKAELTKYENDDIFVIGGGSIYKILLNECKTAYVTYINEYFDADTYFPNLDTMPNWVVNDTAEARYHNGTEFYFRTYTNWNKR